MSVKKFSLALCTVSLFMGTGAFAYDCQPCGDAVYSDGVPMMLSRPAVVAAPMAAGPLGGGTVCRGRTWLDLQVLFIPLLRLGNRRCATVLPAATSMSQVVAAPVACAEQTQCVKSQPAVVPQPTSKTMMLHDKEVTTTTTRLWRRR
jgi:hypothetical protein